MKHQLETWIDRLRQEVRQLSGRAESETGAADVNRTLRRVRFALITVLALQGAWAGSALIRTTLALHTIDREPAEAPRTHPPDDGEKYKPILEMGILGVPPPPQPLQLFGVLGDKALLGDNPGNIQEYTVGGKVPGGEKVVEIGVESVTLEKDGKTRSLTVFPELK